MIQVQLPTVEKLKKSLNTIIISKEPERIRKRAEKLRDLITYLSDHRYPLVESPFTKGHPLASKFNLTTDDLTLPDSYTDINTLLAFFRNLKGYLAISRNYQQQLYRQIQECEKQLRKLGKQLEPFSLDQLKIEPPPVKKGEREPLSAVATPRQSSSQSSSNPRIQPHDPALGLGLSELGLPIRQQQVEQQPPSGPHIRPHTPVLEELSELDSSTRQQQAEQRLLNPSQEPKKKNLFSRAWTWLTTGLGKIWDAFWKFVLRR